MKNNRILEMRFFDIAQGETWKKVPVPQACSGTYDLPISSWDVPPFIYWRLLAAVVLNQR